MSERNAFVFPGVLRRLLLLFFVLDIVVIKTFFTALAYLARFCIVILAFLAFCLFKYVYQGRDLLDL